jgi:hypothetical protein
MPAKHTQYARLGSLPESRHHGYNSCAQRAHVRESWGSGRLPAYPLRLEITVHTRDRLQRDKMSWSSRVVQRPVTFSLYCCYDFSGHSLVSFPGTNC